VVNSTASNEHDLRERTWEEGEESHDGEGLQGRLLESPGLPLEIAQALTPGPDLRAKAYQGYGDETCRLHGSLSERARWQSFLIVVLLQMCPWGRIRTICYGMRTALSSAKVEEWLRLARG
jgi:hypothetical protein